MPLGEKIDHEAGPFIKYLDEEDRVYYYNPRTKLVTRKKPENEAVIMTEEDAYAEVDRLGMLWKGPSSIPGTMESVVSQPSPAKESDAIKTESSTEMKQDDDDSDDESEEEKQDPIQQAYYEVLERSGVTFSSRWQNWLPKLRSEVSFKTFPGDKTREWFENFVRQKIAEQSRDKVKVIEKIKPSLISFLQSTSGQLNLEELFQMKQLPEQLLRELEKLSLIERQTLFNSIPKSTKI